uniref:Guanylate cyclase n=1 Tax=Acrobeloides nanus TaxID=290746 RepID=A0A914E602_9BILA
MQQSFRMKFYILKLVTWPLTKWKLTCFEKQYRKFSKLLILTLGYPSNLDCAAQLAGIWNIPIISYTSSVSSKADNEKYPTLVSVSTTTGNSLSDSLVAIFYGFHWTQAVIIYNIENTDVVNRVTYLLKQFTNTHVQTTAIQLLSNVTEDLFMSRVSLADIKSTTRVLIIIMGDSLSSNAPVLRLLRNNGITSPQFVIILPWLVPTPEEQLPWVNENLTTDYSIYKDYADTFVLDSDRKRTNITDRFSSRLQDLYNISSTTAYKYTTLYDAFKLYVLAVNETFSQNDFQTIKNNTQVYNDMVSLSFEGASGLVQMDFYGERIPNYAIYVINSTNNSTGLTPIAAIDPKRVACNTSSTDEYQTLDCYMLDIQTDSAYDAFWQDVFKKVNIPACGFDGSKCDNSKWYIVSGAVSLIVVSGVIIGLIYRYEKQKHLTQMPWRLPIEKVEIIEHSDRAISTRTNTDTSASSTTYLQGTKGIYLNTVVKIGRYKQLKNISFDQVEAHLLLSVKQLVHDNINPFLGFCYNNPSNELLVLWKYCNRGSLSRYLHNTEMHMNIHFKTAFIRDLINGLDYLHNAPIGYHGKLNTNNCVIDANFIVKLNPVELDDLLEEWKASGSIIPYASDNESVPQNNNILGSALDLEGLTEESLFCAPEFLRKAPPNHIKLARMGKSEQMRIKNQYRSADIYSLAMCIYEILFRQHPFAEINLPTQAIINVIRNPNRDQCRPKIPKMLNRDHHPVILNLMQACWNEDSVIRPPIKRIKKIFSSVYKMKGSLVDSIIAIMDQHANSLEKQVKERTRMLEEAQLRADRLLAQMIPKDIARDLKLGKPVVPRAFTSASVLFTDIVSFTTICSRSTPMEIVNFLNDLFTGYDAIISQLEAYKVETIGDAYLVCSGIPVENGTDHVKVIANIALKMRKYLVDYKLPHIPDHKMEARWGLHSGPLAAGVVGLIAPRYCLFGDTVNVASRMESTGKPGKIQASSEFHFLITQRDDPFIMEKRGTIHVKGKGERVTYWLVDHRQPPVSN